tara:strand:+ start:733 stop:1221 length:489 start_codon:yes stop_codon:yes gene_type:complete
MIQVNITDDMLLKAREKAIEMGRLHNSILRGSGNMSGFIGEQIALHVLGGKWENTYDYDMQVNGLRVDVKTKQTSVEPKPFYECSIAKFNTKQDCDAYAFVRVLNDFSVGWFLGVLTKKEYFDKATFLKKGEVDPSNNYTVKADCYNVRIDQLGEKLNESNT